MKNIIGILLTFIIGGFVGYCVGSPDFPSSDLEGDISKVKRYKKEVVSEYSHVLLDRLQNDTAFLNQTLSAIDALSENADTYYATLVLAEETAKVNAMQNSTELLKELMAKAETCVDVLAAALNTIQLAITNNDAAKLQEIISEVSTANIAFGNQLSHALASFSEEALGVLSAKQSVKDQELLSCALMATSSLGFITAVASKKEATIGIVLNKEKEVTQALECARNKLGVIFNKQNRPANSERIDKATLNMRNAITDAQTVLSISGPRPQGNAISNPEIASLNSIQKQVMVNAKAHSLESLSLITSRLRRPL